MTNETTKNHPVDALLIKLVTQCPRSQADLQHASPLSDFGTIYRLMKLVESGTFTVSRSAPARTIYRIAPANENENKEGEVAASPEQRTGENHDANTIP